MSEIWDPEEEKGGQRGSRISYDDLTKPMAVRINEFGNNGVLGTCTRNIVSGLTMLEEADMINEFNLVDLWERQALFGSPEDCAADPYIFKIVPLTYRTWIYHFYVKNRELIARSVGDHGIIDMVLHHQVIDAPFHAGRWSPVICYMPAMMISFLTADLPTALAAIAMGLFNLTVSQLSNSPFWYRLARPCTFLPRMGFFVFVLLRMTSNNAEGEARGSMAMLVFIVILGLLLADFVLGDLYVLKGISWGCNYTVMKALPKRIFVCRKHGASFLEDPEKERRISQLVTGMGHFDEMVLIAETRGLVVQLKPMSAEDWVIAMEMRTSTGKPPSFVGLDVFNPSRKSFDEIDKKNTIQENAEETGELLT